MRTVSEIFEKGCLYGSVENEITIDIPTEDSENPVQIKNDEIVADSLRLTGSICDDSDLKFGGCIASQFEIEITKDIDLTGREISVYLFQRAIIPTYPSTITFPTEKNTVYGSDDEHITVYPGYTVCEGYKGQSIQIFSGRIFSCKLAKNRAMRKIVAYDDFYWKCAADCTDWYRKLYRDAQAETITLGELRTAITNEIKLIQADGEATLPADVLPVYRIDGQVTYIDLLRQICEFNGCFGYINGEGRLEYKTIGESSYTDVNTEDYEFYIDVETEDFVKTGFDGLYIFGFPNGNTANYALPVGSGSGKYNLYPIEGNSVVTTGYSVYGGNALFDDVYCDPKPGITPHGLGLRTSLADNFTIAYYTPMTLKSEYRSWVEIGDRIKVNIHWVDLNGREHWSRLSSIVLSRTISGIQAMTDEITANGANIKYTEGDLEE